ncbi:hypothetical protein Ctha_1612 [Chloroherpeton thalassium ATCC 35110]|uniref:Uncharacterized protein n=1 Tax=Chloroherpeton thalassium (strain ATCC 35110 / GB-78) TaxID=517418 RepID=B3QSM3_CHLT3|nr:hypothetical protein [Chloroherpeton thalassium]ACF14070.1 hypothetical protein Ctha_1612 [Chloroherpeton thalassium ATCC 35110]
MSDLEANIAAVMDELTRAMAEMKKSTNLEERLQYSTLVKNISDAYQTLTMAKNDQMMDDELEDWEEDDFEDGDDDDVDDE